MAKRAPRRWFNPRIAANLDRAYAEATIQQIDEGLRWYQEAHDVCYALGAKYGLPGDAVCGIVAALSPGRNWEMNIRDTEELLHAWQKGLRGPDLPRVGSYGSANVKKAALIAGGKDPLSVLGGLKVRAFYRCLKDPLSTDAVCLDRHMKYAAAGERLGDKESIIRPGEYLRMEKHFQRAARKVGLLANQFQAILWLVWRDRREEKYKLIDAYSEPRFFAEAA